MIDQAAAARATQEVPSIPRDADGPVFREPWEAQAFAMTLALHERGVFTWTEWAAALAAEIKRAQGGRRSRHRRDLLFALAGGAGKTGGGERRRDTATRCIATRDAWDHACDRTPHGQPIELQPGDFR